MLMRYGRAALIAAIVTLLGNGVWGQYIQQPGGGTTMPCNPQWAAPQYPCNNPQWGSGYDAPPSSSCKSEEKPCGSKNCCETRDCCKDEKCGKDADCCKDGKCCKDSKCECVSGGDCCCKKGECNCKKSSCGKGTCCGCCAVRAKSAKGTTIIVVMPSALPMFPTPADVMGMMPHPMPPMPGMMPPVMPPQAVGLPMPPSPMCYPCPMSAPCIPAMPSVSAAPCKEQVDPCSSLISAACELYSALRPLSVPSMCVSAMGMLSERCCPAAYAQGTPSPVYPMPRELSYQEAQAVSAMPPAPSNACMGYGCGSMMSSRQAEVVPCAVAPMPTTCAKPASDIKVHIVAPSSGDALTVNVGEATCLRCKKSTMTIGNNEITLTRFDDRVRVRGHDLKALADGVRSEGKNRLILEGDVVLHYKKDGHTANVSGDCIELNLSSGAVTIKPAEKTPR